MREEHVFLYITITGTVLTKGNVFHFGLRTLKVRATLKSHFCRLVALSVRSLSGKTVGPFFLRVFRLLSRFK